MCFSAEISFGSGVILTSIGVLSLRESKPSQLYVALIPLMFGVQQITEGFVWISHQYQWSLLIQSRLNYLYLFFANIVWPFWIPFAIYQLKVPIKFQKVLNFSVFLGILVSLFLSYRLFLNEVSSEIICYHIKYKVSYQYPSDILSKLVTVSYLLAISLPTLFHKNHVIKIFGVLILVSYFIAKIIYTNYSTSVWCFFAAIISAFVLYSLKNMNKIAEKV